MAPPRRPRIRKDGRLRRVHRPPHRRTPLPTRAHPALGRHHRPHAGRRRHRLRIRTIRDQSPRPHRIRANHHSGRHRRPLAQRITGQAVRRQRPRRRRAPSRRGEHVRGRRHPRAHGGRAASHRKHPGRRPRVDAKWPPTSAAGLEQRRQGSPAVRASRGACLADAGSRDLDHKGMDSGTVRQAKRYSYYMESPAKFVVYDGVRWHERKSGYYSNGRRGLLHRWVWRLERGDIPDGMQVHHINHDRGDSRVENLDLVSRAEHLRIHPRDSKWHRDGAETAWANAEWREIKCQHCGGVGRTRAPREVKYCSEKCRGTASRARERRVCSVCSAEYECPARNPTRTCSRRCTSVYAYTQRGKGV